MKWRGLSPDMTMVMGGGQKMVGELITGHGLISIGHLMQYTTLLLGHFYIGLFLRILLRMGWVN